jgi:starch synthase
MDILHCSFECYPAAKVGGLADVAGALPKYLNQVNLSTALIMPKHDTPWLNQASFAVDYAGSFRWYYGDVGFRVLRETTGTLGFPLYVVELNDLFLRRGIYTRENGYPYHDEPERYIAFQLAVLNWVKQFQTKPKLIHVHDHHCGLIPLFMQCGPEFHALISIPTVFTIHNGLYQGAFSWDKKYLLPYLPSQVYGLLDWNNAINPMACAVKCAQAVTTVSKGYLQELMQFANGLETLFQKEHQKCFGIINGIDGEVWSPDRDRYIDHLLEGSLSREFKKANKESLCRDYGFKFEKPLFIFIGRLVYEKGADLIPDAINKLLQQTEVYMLLLGSGSADIEQVLRLCSVKHSANVKYAQGYNEPLSHRMYASADFLIMPSRIEPCGLNQLYAMHYGTIPIVNDIGGLRDSVTDLTDASPRGIKIKNATVDELYNGLKRAVSLFQNPELLDSISIENMQIDFSWNEAIKPYLAIYEYLTKSKTMI